MGVQSIPPKILRFVIIGIAAVSLIFQFIALIIWGIYWNTFIPCVWVGVILAMAVINFLIGAGIICGNGGSRLTLKKVICFVGGVMSAITVLVNLICLIVFLGVVFYWPCLIVAILFIVVTACFFIDVFFLNDKA